MEFDCCSLHQTCVETGACVASENPYLTADEVKAYPKICTLFRRLRRLCRSGDAEILSPPPQITELPQGQLSLF